MAFVSMAALIDDIKRVDEYDDEAAAMEVFRKVVSVRLDAADIAKLEAISKQWGVSRTACAQKMLETAILEVSLALRINGAYSMKADANGQVTVTQVLPGESWDNPSGEPLVVQDDALIIGGGEDK